MRAQIKADLRDGICAYLTGGLGNQLFVYAAAYAQSKRLNCPLYIDASALGGVNPRSFELGSLPLGGQVLFEDSPWHGSSPANARWRRRFRGLSVYRERGFNFDAGIFDVTVGTTLVGYFQSYKYFADVARELRASLTTAAPAWVGDAPLGDVHVHVRRGDYLQPGTGAFHGVASPGYFLRALELQRRFAEFNTARVFSDSPAVARAELGGLSGLVFESEVPGATSLESLLVMSRSRRFVLSNSSYSWWAAWLSDSIEFVVAPRPWLASGESASDLLLPEWVTLDAR